MNPWDPSPPAGGNKIDEFYKQNQIIINRRFSAKLKREIGYFENFPIKERKILSKESVKMVSKFNAELESECFKCEYCKGYGSTSEFVVCLGRYLLDNEKRNQLD